MLNAPAALKRRLPLAWMPRAVLPSLTVKSPANTSTTKAPVPVLCKPVVSKPLLSLMNAPPLPTDKVKLPTAVSSASPPLPIAPALPVLSTKPSAVTSMALSPSTTEPPAWIVTTPALLLISPTFRLPVVACTFTFPLALMMVP
ncbi:hypothetical protein MCEMAEM4_03391 [Burkholderiaceae bacterium]